MAAPAYQFQGNEYSTVGQFGTSNFGTGTFGGNLYDPFIVPDLYLGSDDLAKVLRSITSGPEHTRHGQVIGQRTWATTRRWHVVHRGLIENEVDELRTYYEARVFNLLPSGSPTGTVLSVLWRQREFNPQQIRGGRYYLEYDLEERPS